MEKKAEAFEEYNKAAKVFFYENFGWRKQSFKEGTQGKEEETIKNTKGK